MCDGFMDMLWVLRPSEYFKNCQYAQLYSGCIACLLTAALAQILRSPLNRGYWPGLTVVCLYLLGAWTLQEGATCHLQVTFPHNNAVVALVAARSIPRGEQLCISYVDADLAHNPRRRALKFSYGFSCKCPKCVAGS